MRLTLNNNDIKRTICAIAALVVMLFAFAFVAAPAVYATEEDPNSAVTSEQPVDGADAADGASATDAPAATDKANSDAAPEATEETNLMETMLGLDRVLLNFWENVIKRLVVILIILVVLCVGVWIYMMATRSAKLSKQARLASVRRARPVGSAAARTAVNGQRPAQRPVQSEGARPRTVTTEIGDTLRIKRNTTTAQPAGSRSPRPAAPQRPTRPTSQGQPIRQPARPIRPASQGQPRPVSRLQSPQGDPNRIVTRTTATGQRPLQQPRRPDDER